MADNTGAPTMTEIRARYKQVCEGLVLSDGVLNQSTIYKRDVGVLFALIDRLPKDAEGVPIAPGSKVWHLEHGNVPTCEEVNELRAFDMIETLDHAVVLESKECHSTKAAAEAAAKGANDGWAVV